MNASVSANQLFAIPVEQTWETIAAIESYPSRTSSYTKIEPLTSHLRGLGARWKQTRTVWGRDHAQTMEVVEWEPTSSMTLRATEAGTEYQTRYLFSPVDGGTKVTASFTVTPTKALAVILTELSASTAD